MDGDRGPTKPSPGVPPAAVGAQRLAEPKRDMAAGYTRVCAPPLPRRPFQWALVVLVSCQTFPYQLSNIPSNFTVGGNFRVAAGQQGRMPHVPASKLRKFTF
jgi:hypothetical protein